MFIPYMEQTVTGQQFIGKISLPTHWGIKGVVLRDYESLS